MIPFRRAQDVALTPSRTGGRLLDRLRVALWTLHYSARTEKADVGWVRRFILFHGKRHPETMRELEIGSFLSSLATETKVAASTQNQALAALLFLYQEVLGQELQWMGGLIHAKRPAHVPVVLTPAEALSLLAGLTGPTALVDRLLYGAGLRRSRLFACAPRTSISTGVRSSCGAEQAKKTATPCCRGNWSTRCASISRSFARGTRRTWKRAGASWSYPIPCVESTPRLPKNGVGSGCSPRLEPTWTPRPVRPVAISCTRPWFKRKFVGPP